MSFTKLLHKLLSATSPSSFEIISSGGVLFSSSLISTKPRSFSIIFIHVKHGLPLFFCTGCSDSKNARLTGFFYQVSSKDLASLISSFWWYSTGLRKPNIADRVFCESRSILDTPRCPLSRTPRYTDRDETRPFATDRDHSRANAGYCFVSRTPRSNREAWWSMFSNDFF